MGRAAWAEAEQRVDEAIAVSRRSHRIDESWFVAHLGWLARQQGRLDDAAELGRRAVELAARFSDRWVRPTTEAMLGTTLVELGSHPEAVALLSAARRHAEGAAEAYQLRCLAPLAEASGDRAVLAEADALLAGITVAPGSAWLLGADAYLSVARAWLRHGEPARARAVLAPADRRRATAALAAGARRGGAGGQPGCGRARRHRPCPCRAGQGRRARRPPRDAADRRRRPERHLPEAGPPGPPQRRGHCNATAVRAQLPGRPCPGTHHPDPGVGDDHGCGRRHTDGVPRAVRERPGRDRGGRQRRRRAPARALQRSREGRGHRRGARRAGRLRPALRDRMAARAGRWKLRPVRRGVGEVLAVRGAGVLPGRAGQRDVPARGVPDGTRGVAGRTADHRRLPHRGGNGLARAGARRVPRLRGVLPARLPGQPGPQLAARPGRGRGEAAGGRAGRRRRMRARRVLGDPRRRPTRRPQSSARTTTPSRSSWPASGPRTPGCRTG